MKPDDLWVVINIQSNTILHVYLLESMADRKAEWYWESGAAPYSGSIPNYNKISVMTLSEAVKTIQEAPFY